MVDSLRQNRAHPTVLAAAKLMHCTACQESARMLSRPVISSPHDPTTFGTGSHSDVPEVPN